MAAVTSLETRCTASRINFLLIFFNPPKIKTTKAVICEMRQNQLLF